MENFPDKDINSRESSSNRGTEQFDSNHQSARDINYKQENSFKLSEYTNSFQYPVNNTETTVNTNSVATNSVKNEETIRNTASKWVERGATSNVEDEGRRIVTPPETPNLEYITPGAMQAYQTLGCQTNGGGFGLQGTSGCYGQSPSPYSAHSYSAITEGQLFI